MNNYCTFYIVRHGQSEANVTGDWGVDTVLTSLGKEQAHRSKQELSKIPFSAIFSSDFLRAKQTADIIALEHTLEVQATKVLRERNYGIMEGTNTNMWATEIRDAFEAWYSKEYEQRLKEKMVEGMESDEEVISRTITFLRETALVYPGKNVLVVAHGDLMQTLLVHLGYGKHKQYHFEGIKNTGYVILRCDGVDFFIEGVKDIELMQLE